MLAPDLALVLVGEVDRRVLPALALAPQLATAEARAVHLAFDADAARQLALDWMEVGLSRLPLHIEEPPAPTLTRSVRQLVERELTRHQRVTAIVPEFDLGRWWQPLLHRGRGREIAWDLHGLPGVVTVVLPVRVDLGP